MSTLLDTVGSGSLTSGAFASYGSLVSLDAWSWYANDEIYNIPLTVTTSTSSSLISEMMDLEKNGYNTVQAMTYIESCSIEERDDLINQIDQLLNEESKSDVKTLSRRI